MTVGDATASEGDLLRVVRETPLGDGSSDVSFDARSGVIHADLRVGANIVAAQALRANGDISSPGLKLHGAGFIVSREEAASLGLGHVPELDAHIREYRNGRDLADRPRGVMVIDLFGLDADEVRQRFPAVYQWVAERVKPERDHNKRATYRDNWWVFGEPRRQLRPALASLPRYIATAETTKHRLFQFLDASIAPDNMLIAVALPDATVLGVLSSRVHVPWALSAGGRLGIGNDPRYNKSRCFEPFPFPNLTPHPDLAAQIAATAEELDAHRKRQQAAHTTLTLTDMYNVLDALRLARPLTAKEKLTHTHGLVSVLAELHDKLDAMVLQAYGWADLAPALVGQPGGTLPWPEKPAAQAEAEEELLLRLVALNAERAAEEARGEVRWLRPEFQDPARRTAPAAPPAAAVQDEIELDEAPAPSAKRGAAKPAAAAARRAWPAALPEQVRAVAEVLSAAAGAVDEAALAQHFTGRGPWKKRLPNILLTLEALGRARREGAGWRA